MSAATSPDTAAPTTTPTPTKRATEVIVGGQGRLQPVPSYKDGKGPTNSEEESDATGSESNRSPVVVHRPLPIRPKGESIHAPDPMSGPPPSIRSEEAEGPASNVVPSTNGRAVFFQTTMKAIVVTFPIAMLLLPPPRPHWAVGT